MKVRLKRICPLCFWYLFRRTKNKYPKTGFCENKGCPIKSINLEQLKLWETAENDYRTRMLEDFNEHINKSRKK